MWCIDMLSVIRSMSPTDWVLAMSLMLLGIEIGIRLSRSRSRV